MTNLVLISASEVLLPSARREERPERAAHSAREAVQGQRRRDSAAAKARLPARAHAALGGDRHASNRGRHRLLRSIGPRSL